MGPPRRYDAPMGKDKREYERPEIVELGSLADLTRGGGPGSGPDIKGFTDKGGGKP